MTVDEYLARYGSLLAERLACAPLQSDVPIEVDILRKPYPAQVLAISAIVKLWRRQKAAILGAEQGTGKTLMAAAACHTHARGPYRALVLCPPHLLGTWFRELEVTIRDVQVKVVESRRDVREGPGWFLLAETTAKLGEYSVARHIQKRSRFDYLIVDECHEHKAANSARAVAFSRLLSSCRKVLCQTGTLTAGRADHLRPLLFRLDGKALRASGLGWYDYKEYVERFGRTETKEVTVQGKRRPRRHTRTVPGIMPTLYGRHLMDKTIFLTLEDVAEGLPEYREIMVSVEMDEDMVEPYRHIEGKLTGALRRALGRAWSSLLGPMLQTLLTYPDYPYDWKTIGYQDGPERIEVTTPRTLKRFTPWPKELKLLEIIRKEREEGRQVWVYVESTRAHPVLAQLEKLIRKWGYQVKSLLANRVPPRKRGAWIRKHAPGLDVMISHPKPVATGVNLFGKDYNFPTLIFYQMGYDLFTLRQASRRSWRIGQTEECRVYYLHYKDTLQEKALQLMSRKLQASLALEGRFTTEGLAAICNDVGSMEVELARGLLEKMDNETHTPA